MTDRLASGAQLYRINEFGLNGEPISARRAQELLADWYAQHPELQKPRKPPRESRKRTRKRRQGTGEAETTKLERLRARHLRDALRDDVEAEPPPVTIVLLPAKEP